MRGVLKVLYVPIMLVGFNAVAVWLLLEKVNPLWLLPLFAVAVVVSGVVERIIPHEAAWNGDQGEFVRDLVHAMVNLTVIVSLIVLLRPSRSIWPHAWPMWAQFVMAVVISDIGITLAHYLSHRINWLWRFHVPHHAMTRMYGFNGLIQHPVHQAIEVIVGGAALVMLGMPRPIGLLLAFAVAVQLLLQHSNADMKIGKFDWLLAVAPVHRRHHLRSFEGHGVNFGLFTNIWDHLLGTADLGREARVGVGEVGLDDPPEYPQGYLAQLVEPFSRQREPRRPEASEPAS